MNLITPSAIDAAERFVWLSGRLIDRLRFAQRFRGAAPEPVLAALRPYQNSDGGFGNALEPDLRTPLSQPQPVEVALHLLDELDAFDHPMVAGACDYLATITTDEGGVPFMLPSALPYPHAPWWQCGDQPAASLNPTAAIAGLLHRHRVQHPWLPRATAFCWDRLDRLERSDPYEMVAVLTFLEHVPDRPRAEATIGRMGRLIAEQQLATLDPGTVGEGRSPLDLAPNPDRARQLFGDDVVNAHLDWLVAAQGEDGGWPVTWPIWTPATGPEWRAFVTIDALARLRTYGRWT
jgi:hypothetical protein